MHSYFFVLYQTIESGDIIGDGSEDGKDSAPCLVKAIIFAITHAYVLHASIPATIREHKFC